MVLVENCNATSWSDDTVVEMEPVFFSGAPPWPGKNVTMLVAPVEQSSQELCDLYRKAANLDVKTVLEGGHNNQVQMLHSFHSVLYLKRKFKPCNFR